MPSHSMIRLLKIFLITATFLGCSHSSFSQQFIPPIDMTLTEFNKGRPENFYYLAEASEGQDQVCEAILSALNEPYPAEPNVGNTELYSKYLLRSRLSVPWLEIPFFGRTGDRGMYDFRYASVDFNNDGEPEDLFVTVMNQSAMAIHHFVWVEKGVFPAPIEALSTPMWMTILDKNANAKGQELTQKLENLVFEVYIKNNLPSARNLSVDSLFVDIVDVEGTRYILYTSAGSRETKRDTFAVQLNSKDEISPVCRLTSRYVRVSR